MHKTSIASVRALLSGAALAVVVATEPQAAQVDILETIDGPQIVMIAGPIEDGNDMVFAARTRGIEDAIVLLRGPGGSPIAAMNIGAVISERGFDTAIVPYAECDSGCALVWLAGAERFMAPTARLNLTIDSASTQAAPSLPALQNLIRSYLRDIDMTEANRGITYSRDGAVPDLWMDRAETAELGIEITISEQELALPPAETEVPEEPETTEVAEAVAAADPAPQPVEPEPAPEAQPMPEVPMPETPTVTESETEVTETPEPEIAPVTEAVTEEGGTEESATGWSDTGESEPTETAELPPDPETVSDVETTSTDQPLASEVVVSDEDTAPEVDAEPEAPEELILALPPDQRWIVLASSRDETALTRDNFANLPDNQSFLRVRTQNGMFAAAIGPFANAEVSQTRSELIRQGAIPGDSYISTGGGFVEKVD